MQVCLMIEGQEGVAWSEWSALARAAESAGLHGLFRSDHYTSFHGEPGGGPRRLGDHQRPGGDHRSDQAGDAGVARHFPASE